MSETEPKKKRKLYVFRWSSSTRAAIASDVKEAESMCRLPPDADTRHHLEVDVYDFGASQRVELPS